MEVVTANSSKNFTRSQQNDNNKDNSEFFLKLSIFDSKDSPLRGFLFVCLFVFKQINGIARLIFFFFNDLIQQVKSWQP